jgi:hypothetical protein
MNNHVGVFGGWLRVPPLALALFLLALVPSRSGAQEFSTLPSFVGAPGGSLSESMLAVGPDRILELTPHWIAFFQKNGTEISRTHVNTWFASQLAGFIAGDPVCYYDAIRGRYLLVVMATGDSTLLWISKENADPTNPANWWKYLFRDGGRDYPGLGVSDDKLAVRVNNSNRTYVLDRARAYAGDYPEMPGVAPVTGLGASVWLKPCRNTTSDSTLHFVGRGTGEVVYWTVTGPPDSLDVNGPMSITIPDAPGIFGEIGGEQPDTSAFNSCEPRLLRGHVAAPVPAAYVRNGNITLTWTVARDYADGSPTTSAVRVVRFRTSDRAVLDDFQVGKPGMSYAWGSAVEDDHGTIFVGYDRFSPNEWPSCYMVARRDGHQSPEFLVKAGTSSYLNCVGFNCATPSTPAAWGDYTSIVVDEFATTAELTTVRYVGQWTPGSHTSGTAIGTMRASYGGSGISGSVRKVPGGGTGGVPVELFESGALIARAETNASGAFNLGFLPAGTYLLRMALDPAVAVAATAGGGGTVLSNSEIEFTLGPDDLSIGTRFGIAPQPAPAIDSLSVTAVEHTDPSFDLVVHGHDFKPYSTVRIDGRDKATTYDGPGSLTARVLHYDIARSGPNTVTVYTPAAPGAGTSGPDTLLTKHRYLVSQAFNTRFAACPAGDAGRLTGTVVMRGDAACGVDAQTLEARIVFYAESLTPWGADSLFPPYPIYSIPGSVAYDPGTGLATIGFDFGAFSDCQAVAASWQYRSNADPNWRAGGNLALDVRSFDLSRLVHGAVDRFDTDALAALMGTTQPCGDFTLDGQVSLSDLAMFSVHMGHHYHPRKVDAPNGGESYARGPGPVTIPIRWERGWGDSATVTLNLVRDTTVTTIASNLADDGGYDWTQTCSPPPASNYRVEVVHTAGVFLPGHATLGSDRSDGTFAITGSCGGGGGCPFVDTWAAGRWVEENSILGRSADGQLVRDLHRLTAEPDREADGTIRLRVRESERERTRLARADLVVVDRDPDQASRVVDGRILVGRRETAWKVRSASGEDLTSLFAGPVARGFEGRPGDVLTIELFEETHDVGARFPEGEFGGAWLAAVKKEVTPTGVALAGSEYDRAVLEQSGIVIEKPDGEGGWVETAHLYPREHRADLGSNTGRVFRLRFVGRHRIEGIGWFRLAGRQAEPLEIAPAIARHSRLDDVRGSLGKEGAEVVLSPGESIELTYRVPPLAEGMVRDYYLASRGVYTTLDPTQPALSNELPKRLELSPPKPNPTRGLLSRVSFALPTAARVRIKVYDAQGRLTRTLLDESREAGFHEVHWNARDAANRPVPSGVYFYRMEVGSWRQEQKVVVSN